jgi:hypothetical protein
MRRAMLGPVLALFLPMSAHAACEAPEFHQFDFWLGDWEVVGVDGAPNAGQVLGHNRIERVSAGCGLSEHWRGASGFDGRSLNTWDAASRQWRQFWVGGDGVLLQLAGGLRDGAMVMEGELPTASGGVQRQRIRWTPAPDGSVIQHWETSDDAGRSWNTSFLGHYRRAAPP